MSARMMRSTVIRTDDMEAAGTLSGKRDDEPLFLLVQQVLHNSTWAHHTRECTTTLTT